MRDRSPSYGLPDFARRTWDGPENTPPDAPPGLGGGAAGARSDATRDDHADGGGFVAVQGT